MARGKTSLREVAEAAGVAISTVSHVLNGTASISDEVRARVLEVAGRMGYLAQRQAKGAIASISAVMIAVPEDAMPENDVNIVSWTVLSTLTQDCAARGIKVVPFTLEAEQPAGAVIAAARQAGVDGVLVLNDDRPDLLAGLAADGLPVVLINGEDADMQIDSVTPGNRFAAQKAVTWLITQGFERIVHLTWEGRKTVRRRLDGFRDGLAEAGREIRSEDVLFARGYEPQFGQERVRAWLEAEGRPTGQTVIFCAADNLAFGAIRAIHAAGLRVPQDISVMGFDGLAPGEFSTPALSTVSIPLSQFAEEALFLLQQRILAAPLPRAARRVELGCDIIDRASVAPSNQ